MLAGKRILVTGVVTRDSIAYHVAERAQRAGAEVILTGFGRSRRMTERAAARLPHTPDVLELDVNRPEDFEALADALRERWGGVDGALHAIAFAPPDALGGAFLDTPTESAGAAFTTSAYSLKALAASLLPAFEEGDAGGSLVALDFDASVAWPAYDWMGVAKAALEATGALPRARPRFSGRAREPDLRRAAAHPRGRRYRRVRGAGRCLAGPGAARLGRRRPRTGGRRHVLPALGSRARHQRRDPSCGRRLPRDGGAARSAIAGAGRERGAMSAAPQPSCS